jgi:hypothetical protein
MLAVREIFDACSMPMTVRSRDDIVSQASGGAGLRVHTLGKLEWIQSVAITLVWRSVCFRVVGSLGHSIRQRRYWRF